MGGGINLLDIVTMKGVARHEYKDQQHRLSGVKNFIVLTGMGTTYNNSGRRQMKHFTARRK